MPFAQRLALLIHFEVLDDVFDRLGPNYKKDDPAMKTIFAQL